MSGRCYADGRQPMPLLELIMVMRSEAPVRGDLQYGEFHNRECDPVTVTVTVNVSSRHRRDLNH